MYCEQVREAVSAQIDGEEPGLPPGNVAAYLAGCAACRGWQQRAHLLTRRARLSCSFLDHDLAPAVLASLQADQGAQRPRRARPARLGLLAVRPLARGRQARLAGFLVLLAVIFVAAHAAGARSGPLTPGQGRVQYTGGTAGSGQGADVMNMGGMSTGESP